MLAGLKVFFLAEAGLKVEHCLYSIPDSISIDLGKQEVKRSIYMEMMLINVATWHGDCSVMFLWDPSSVINPLPSA